MPKAKKTKKKRRLRCDDCGVLKEDTERTADPYAEDLYGEKNEMNLCRKCYQNRCDDI